ncbi:RtcB family protein [Candidatus Parcubacteria bacterium]|nr:RtcB family protein [Candidatus Parcubacteria bacterium]
MEKTNLKQITDYLWEIPQSFRSDMRVPARVYASETMLDDILADKALEQAVNVATLPGIQRYSLVMPDVHWGYGAPVGAVFATDVPNGVISPGSVGYDVNCGVRLLASEKRFDEVRPRLEELASAIYREVPSGVGRSGRLTLKDPELDQMLQRGAKRMVELGYGEPEDLQFQEAGGSLEDAQPEQVSSHAKNRGRDQLGTMGAGNHFVEVERVDRIYDEAAAQALGLWPDQVTVLIHTGSRGLGHQVATDFIKTMLRKMREYGIELPDPQLAAVPLSKPEGGRYFSAMAAAANFAWANRQLITWEVRKAWQNVLGVSGGRLRVVYDVAHNIAKRETYGGKDMLVHRKGATRAFGPGHPEVPAPYRDIGQPVLIPGSMGTASYVLVGTTRTMTETFGSTCHGAGRRMSRTAAKRQVGGPELKDALAKQGIAVRAGSLSGLAEEAPIAYKDVDAVVEVVDAAGIAKRVARLVPVAVVKG